MGEEIICPFCHNRNVSHISEVQIEGTERKRDLYRCNNFDVFFWGDTGERVHKLSQLCKTRWLEPEKCDEHIFVFFPQHEIAESALGEIRELDLICSQCPKRNFVLVE